MLAAQTHFSHPSTTGTGLGHQLTTGSYRIPLAQDLVSDTPAADSDHEHVRYPKNSVVGIIESTEQVTAASKALIAAGFLNSEVEVMCGQTAAEKLRAHTGRTGPEPDATVEFA